MIRYASSQSQCSSQKRRLADSNCCKDQLLGDWLNECDHYRSTAPWRVKKRRRIWQHIRYLERKMTAA